MINTDQPLAPPQETHLIFLLATFSIETGMDDVSYLCTIDSEQVSFCDYNCLQLIVSVSRDPWFLTSSQDYE